MAVRGVPDMPALSPAYLAMVGGMPDGVLLYDRAGSLVHANRAALRALDAMGLLREGVALADVDLVAGVVPADQPMLREAMLAASAGRSTPSLRLHLVQGAVEAVAAASFNPLELDGRFFVQVIARDITARAAAEQAVAASEQRLRAMFTHSPVGMAIVEQGRFVSVNPMMCRILGRDEDQLVGLSADDITHPEDLARNDYVRQVLDRDETAKVFKRYLRPDGSVVWGELIAVRLTDDTDGRTLVHLRDITGEREAAQHLQHMANHDVLTGLGNRMLVEARLGQALAQRSEDRSGTAVLFVDLDGFKRVNDALGHAVGDRVLKEAARRIRDVLRPADTVGRWGGDEFVVVLEDVAGVQAALDAADRVRTAIARPIPHRNDELFITASIGVAYAAAQESFSPAELLNGADSAMYNVKAAGRDGRSVFDQALRDAATRRVHIEEVLHSAVEEDRVVLHFQPLVELATRQVVGAEALLRLKDDDGSLLYPDVFLDIAEDIGAMRSLEVVVLEQACKQAAGWRGAGFDVSVSINVCSAQIQRIEEFELELERMLGQSGLPASSLVCEVTEHTLIDTTASTVKVMERLRASGIEWAVDDFGTGYSSMTYLQLMPLSEVKIDRRFVAMAGEDARAAAIVRAVAGLAAELGMRCVAEGIEEEQTHDLAQALGASRGQGYLYARPMPAEAFLSFLDRRVADGGTAGVRQAQTWPVSRSRPSAGGEGQDRYAD